MRFSGKKVVIIGGNSGIGRAAAEAFAAEGAELVLCGRDETTLAETTLQTAGDEIVFVHAEGVAIE